MTWRRNICRYGHCENEALAPSICDVQIVMCGKHLAAAAHTFNSIWHVAYEIDTEENTRRREEQARDRCVVYYLRRNNLAKIGTTSYLVGRLTELRPDEVLAIEPGSYELETARHQQFKHLRVGGEWFRLTDELLDHVDAIVDKHRDWARPRVLDAYRRATEARSPFLAAAWAPLALKHPTKVT